MSYRKYFHNHVKILDKSLLNTQFGALSFLGYKLDNGVDTLDPEITDPETIEWYKNYPTGIYNKFWVNNFMYILYQDGTEPIGYHTLLCPVESIKIKYGDREKEIGNLEYENGGSRFPSHEDFDTVGPFPVYPDELYIRVRNLVYEIDDEGAITQYQLEKL